MGVRFLAQHGLTTASAPPAPVGGWDISNATSEGSHIAGESALPEDVWIKPDGTRMYVIGSSSNEEIEEYSLTTPFSLASGVSHITGHSHAGAVPDASGIWISDDGTKVFLCSVFGSDPLAKYTMSPAWDFSTLTNSQTVSVNSYDAGPQDIAFKPDGTILYLLGSTGDVILQIPLSIAWDLNSLGTVSNTFSLAGLTPTEGGPSAIYIKPDGTQIFVLGDERNGVIELTLSTAWDLSSASETGSFTPGYASNQVKGICFDPTGFHMYVIDRGLDTVHHYNVPSS